MKDRGSTPTDVLGPLNDLERKHAPAELFLAGDRSLLRHPGRVCVVGTREAGPAALRRAARLSRILAQHDIVVVSGLAAGVDTAAHRAAMAAGGRTIAVIGTPLDRSYPRENAELQAEIAAHHLVVSQFASGQRVGRWCFPQRNRTMALIAGASVIVEAGESSGTLSAGWEALRLHRPLFIMKSIVTERPDLMWTREMIEYGAMILEHPQQVLDAAATPRRSDSAPSSPTPR
jgi:DNA processing protein